MTMLSQAYTVEPWIVLISLVKISLAVLLVLIVRCAIIDEYFTPLARIPHSKPSWLISLLRIYARFSNTESVIVKALHDRHGSIVRVGTNWISISNPEAIKAIYMSYQFPKSNTYDVFSFVEPNIFSTRDATFHRRRKKLVAPIYSHHAMLSMGSLVHQVGVQKLIQILRVHADTNESVDLLQSFRLMALSVIGEVGFGCSFDTLAPDKMDSIPQLIDDTTDFSLMKHTIGPMAASLLFRKKHQSLQQLKQFARDIIQAKRQQHPDRRANVLRNLIESVEVSGERLTDDQLISETMFQIIAGTDTSGVTLVWIFYFLEQHPDCLARLRAEINTAFPNIDEPVTYDILRHLPYLNAVINESQRLRPVAPFGLSRDVPKGGIELDGYFIPEGTSVKISFRNLQEDESVFPEPLTFRPERWLTDETTLTTMRHHFLPFMIGPRVCVGRALALLEIRMTVAELIRRFEFTVPPGLKEDMHPVQRFVYRPKDNRFTVHVHSID